MATEFKLPDLGEGITEAQIVRVMIAAGDQISEDQPLMEVETDKAAVEIPSPVSGTIATVHVGEGDTVTVGTTLVTFAEGAEEAASAKPAVAQASAARGAASVATATARPSTPAAGRSAPAGRAASRIKPAAAPATRKLARERGVDLYAVTGTGPGGRITRGDVEAAVGAKPGAPPARTASPSSTAAPVTTRPADLEGTPDTDKWGDIVRQPMSQIRKTIAAQMTKSAFTAAHVTHFDECDITELDRLRTDLARDGTGTKVTFMPFVMKIVAVALQKFPEFNASLDDERQEVVYKRYVSIGVAVDTPRGLIVPVVRHVDRMTILELSAALRDVAERIRATKFGIEDLRGGTFTITNIGALGGTHATPIINHPEVAILGLGRARRRPMVVDERIEPRLVLPLSLSFDHRVTDGAQAARFTSEIVRYLQTPARLLVP